MEEIKEIKARFTVMLYKYMSTQAKEYIGTYDIDDFSNLITVLRAAMLQEIDVAIMNCGEYQEKDRPHYQSIEEVIKIIDKN